MYVCMCEGEYRSDSPNQSIERKVSVWVSEWVFRRETPPTPLRLSLSPDNYPHPPLRTTHCTIQQCIGLLITSRASSSAMDHILAHHIQHILVKQGVSAAQWFGNRTQCALYVWGVTVTRAKVDSSPPTMKVRVPAAAPVTPPLVI